LSTYNYFSVRNNAILKERERDSPRNIDTIIMSQKQTKEVRAPKANKSTPATQQYLSIAEIKNDTIILKDGSLRAVLLVASVNFFLKSEDEQNAIIQSYMQFLNSFDFQLQIIVQSRKFDITRYLEHLGKFEKLQTNELLRIQMADYRQFVSELVELGQIMDKKFFVVVPYDPVKAGKKGFMSQMKSVFSAAIDLRLKHEEFMNYKHFLDLRVGTVTSALTGMSLNTQLLNTQALIELFYTVYNPDTSAVQKLADVEKMQVEET